MSARHSAACSYMEGDRHLVLLGGYGRDGAPLKGLACTHLELLRHDSAVSNIARVYHKGTRRGRALLPSLCEAGLAHVLGCGRQGMAVLWRSQGA